MLSTGEVTTILSDAVWTVILASAPMMIIAIAVGLIISIFQATTQINEQTLSFVPRIIAVLLALVFFSGFIANVVTGFVFRLDGAFDAMLR
jgi:flagellar biosynthetic protein FliQ